LASFSSEASLESLVTARRRGFETMIDFMSAKAQLFEVVALDASGQVIARSDPVTANKLRNRRLFRELSRRSSWTLPNP
jgi:hypothetical protein